VSRVTIWSGPREEVLTNGDKRLVRGNNREGGSGGREEGEKVWVKKGENSSIFCDLRWAGWTLSNTDLALIGAGGPRCRNDLKIHGKGL